MADLEINPAPKRVIRCSKRVGIAILCVVALVACVLVYGGMRRRHKAQVEAGEAGLQANAQPATQAAKEIVAGTPAGSAPYVASDGSKGLPAPTPEQLKAMGAQPPGGQAPPPPACGIDPKTNQTYRFNPDTGAPCAAGAAVPQPVTPPPPPVAASAPVSAPAVEQEPKRSPQEEAIIAAFKRQQQAMLAPTGVSFAAKEGVVRKVSDQPGTSDGETREAFLSHSRHNNDDKDYLPTAREAALSAYEVKSGLDIPCLLEGSINSDLPGPVNALVRSNVYDTVTGQYLLIPQGSRLVGKYDSNIVYGQSAVQVTWSRLMFPDGSSMDLNGMPGVDAQGNAGLHDQVDRHYKRLLGMSALGAAMSAGFALSQSRNQSALTYPSPATMAAAAAAQDFQTTTSQITRQNLNVPPTIKVRAGAQFSVRVMQDMTFDGPYEPMSAPLPIKQKFGAEVDIRRTLNAQ